MHQSQGEQYVVPQWALAHQFIKVKEEIQGIALNSGSSTLIFRILISRLFRADTDLTLCQLVKHQQAPALLSSDTPCREKGWALSWLIVRAIMSPQHPTVHTSTIPSINKGVYFPLPLWCVTLCCRFVFNVWLNPLNWRWEEVRHYLGGQPFTLMLHAHFSWLLCIILLMDNVDHFLEIHLLHFCWV